MTDNEAARAAHSARLADVEQHAIPGHPSDATPAADNGRTIEQLREDRQKRRGVRL